jgi:hypothetical protein
MAIFPTLCVEKFNITGGFGRLERQTWHSSGLGSAQGVKMLSLRIPSAALHGECIGMQHLRLRVSAEEVPTHHQREPKLTLFRGAGSKSGSILKHGYICVPLINAALNNLCITCLLQLS